MVPGFANAGMVATLVSGESGEHAQRSRPESHRRPERRPERKPEHRTERSPDHRPEQKQQVQRAEHRSRPMAPQKQHDPIFSKPYEPGVVTAVAKVAEPVTAHAKRGDRPVAALLGGLKRV